MNTILFNRRGFSIVEVLIATGIGIIGALAISHLAINNMQMSKHTETVGLLTGFSQEMRSILSVEDVCSSSLLGAGAMATQTFTPGAGGQQIQVNTIKVGTPTRTLATLGQPIPGVEELLISDLRISDFTDISPTATPNSLFAGNLWVSLEKTGTPGLGNKSFRRQFPMILKTVTSGGVATITGCSLGTTEPSIADVALLCTRSGGQYASGVCRYPMQAATSAGDCAVFGMGYTWNGTTCLPPVTERTPSSTDMIGVYTWETASAGSAWGNLFRDGKSDAQLAAEFTAATALPDCTADVHSFACSPKGYQCKESVPAPRYSGGGTWYKIHKCVGNTPYSAPVTPIDAAGGGSAPE